MRSRAQRIVALAVLALVVFVFSTEQAEASHCGIEFQNGGFNNYFFDDYYQTEYKDGFLIWHFKLKEPYNDGRGWTSRIYFLNDECDQAISGAFEAPINLPAGLQYFSVRFTSSAHVEIWNDETDMPVNCAECSRELDGNFAAALPYYEVYFHGFINNGASYITSTARAVLENPPPPPLKTETLPTPAGCEPPAAYGYFFDEYERAEYEKGFLRYNLRLKIPYNDGRSWNAFVRFYDKDCQFLGQHPTGTSGSVMHITPFSRYFSVRFASSTDYEIWNDEVEEKEECAGCSADIPPVTPLGLPYEYVSFYFSRDNGATTFSSTPFRVEKVPAPHAFDPVIIIPGILGSSDKNGVWVLDPISHTYDNLVATLAVNGYTLGINLFTMPYDWRQSNVLTALELRDQINRVQEVCGCEKVDVVAHSMGGLAARQYIQSDYYENDVDQLIFLGTPHLGAPKAYLMWEAGENDFPFRDQVVKFMFSREAKKAGFDSLFHYIRNRPILSVQELLPIYDYLRDKGSDNLKAYPGNYPQNIFLENLNANIDKLFSSGVRLTNITGDSGTSTINFIRVVESSNLPQWEHGYPEGFYEKKPEDRGLERGPGDDTVASSSAKFIKSDLQVYNADHSSLPTYTEGVIYKELTGRDHSILVNDSRWISAPLLIIKILSPADILVTAPNGEKIGKNFETGEEFDEIDGAFYSGFETDNEYITIPDPLDGEYTVEVQGTGTGAYTVSTAYITDNSSAEEDFSGYISPGNMAELNISVASTSESVALDVEPEDIARPHIKTISPVGGEYPRSTNLPVHILITDEGAGVSSSTALFDDRMISASTTVDLFFESLGAHRIKAFAEDAAANATSSEVTFQVIATLESTIADIERAYDLGWIKEERTEKQLARKIQALIKHKAKGKRLEVRHFKSILSYLEKEHPKRINDQAYELLKEDINWLINSLPQ